MIESITAKGQAEIKEIMGLKKLKLENLSFMNHAGTVILSHVHERGFVNVPISVETYRYLKKHIQFRKQNLK